MISRCEYAGKKKKSEPILTNNTYGKFSTKANFNPFKFINNAKNVC